MNKLYKILILIISIVTILEGVLIFRQNKEIKKLTNTVNEISTKNDTEVDLSDVESKIEDLDSRIDDVESEGEDLKRKINTTSTSSYFDAEYENRKLERRIDELENKIRYTNQ